ncbi:MAG: 8-oxoguanine DNA glycosylase, N-terminal domain-containing protein, partial [Oscillospiraceae bacterium]|nr:8-oxoguanine DNA glycosylase, N-terminal domain-containing protein [Oscillospiraceae bacterium]
MKYEAIQGDIVLYQEDFDLAQTLDCGQAFRWKCDENGIWSGYYLDRYLELYHKKENVIVFKNTNEEDFLNIWSVYFDLDTDYSVLKKRFSEDDILKNAYDFAGGIRLLRQDSW